MKKTIGLFAILMMSTVSFAKEPGFYYNNETINNNSKAWKALKANMLADETDLVSEGLCYEGDWEEALETTTLEKGWSLSVIDVYGESQYPRLDTEFSGPKKFTFGTVTSACD